MCVFVFKFQFSSNARKKKHVDNSVVYLNDSLEKGANQLMCLNRKGANQLMCLNRCCISHCFLRFIDKWIAIIIFSKKKQRELLNKLPVFIINYYVSLCDIRVLHVGVPCVIVIGWLYVIIRHRALTLQSTLLMSASIYAGCAHFKPNWLIIYRMYCIICSYISEIKWYFQMFFSPKRCTL